MIELNELINVVIDLFCIFLLFLGRYKIHLVYFRLFNSAVVLIVLSHLFSVIESFLLPDLFNILEHSGMLAAAILFCTGIYRYFLSPGEGK